MEIYKFDNSKLKINKKKIIIIVIVLIFVLFLLLYKVCYPFRNLVNSISNIKPSINLSLETIYMDNESIGGIAGYDKYLSILNQNKLLTFTTKEKAVFEDNLKISNMISAESGRYLVIAQKDSKELYLYNSGKIKYEISVPGAISKVCVNKNGYVAVSVEKSGYRSIIVLYNPEGQEIFTTYLVNKYANDIKISNNNKYLAFSEIDTSGIQPVSKIKFIKIDKVGTEDYIIDTEAENNIIISKIQYYNNEEIVYLTDNKIKKIDINGIKTDVLDLSNKNILNVDISLGNIIVLVEKSSDSLFKNSNDIKTYNLDGELIGNYNIAATIKHLRIKDNIISANIGQTVYFVNTSGRLINKYEFNSDIKDIFIYDNGKMAALIYRNKIELIYI